MAGLIPQSFIDDLLARTDIIDVIGERISLKKSGRNHQALCPFHKEKSPSFSANQDKQFYYCFGCGVSGNAVGFVMDHDHVDFPEAVEMLARRAGMQVPREAGTLEKRERYDSLYQQLDATTKWYMKQLLNHDSSHKANAHKANDYLKRRGLDQATIARFQIGYAPPGWSNLIQELGNTPERLRLLLDAGLVVENEEKKSTYDRFRDRIIFPIRDQRGRVIAFGGRVMGDEKPKYLNSPETAVFHKGQELYGLYEARQANRELSQILVVEGYMDVIALAQQGINNAVATLGTATTADHLNIIFKHTNQVTFCFDGDNAGRQAAWRALENAIPAMNDGRQIRFLFLPQGEDPDSLVRKEGPDAFLARLKDKQQALPFEDYFFRHFEQDIDTSTLDGKARLVHKVTPFIHKLPEGSFKSLMVKRLGELSDLGTDAVSSIIQTNIETRTNNISQLAYNHKTDDVHQRDDKITEQWSNSYSGNIQSKQKIFVRYHSSDPYRSNRATPVPDIQLRPQQQALRILLDRPDLAKKLEAPAKLIVSDEDTRFLVMLVESLARNPVTSTYGVLGSWYGTHLGDRLLALMKTDIPVNNAEQTFRQCLRQLSNEKPKHTNEINDIERLRLVSAGQKHGWLERKQRAQQENDTKH